MSRVASKSGGPLSKFQDNINGSPKLQLKIIFVPAIEIRENTTNILNYDFQNKFTLLYIKLNIYM